MNNFNMNEYNTKWIKIELNNQFFEFVHYKKLDGNKVIIKFTEKEICCSKVTTEHRTTEESNCLLNDLLTIGWKETKNECV